jgi:hypothetical protein
MATPWSARWPSPSRSSTSLALAALALAVLALGGCGDGECGPGDEPGGGVTVTAGDTTVTYGAFTSSPNHDCTVEGHPTSLTLESLQTDPAPSRPFYMTFCLPRPDELAPGTISLADDRLIEVVDVFAEVDGCVLSFDRTLPPDGSVTIAGYCREGLHPDGYAISLAGSLPGVRTCDGDAEPIELTLGGVAAVEAL